MKNLLPLLFLPILIGACNQKGSNPTPAEESEPHPMSQFEWMIGTWQMEGQPVYESWNQKENQLSGRTFYIQDGDTTAMEEVNLLYQDEKYVYTAFVEGQNDGRTISFTMSNLDYNSPKYENPEHDFPQLIHYDYIAPDSIKIFLKGTPDKEMQYYLVRHE